MAAEPEDDYLSTTEVESWTWRVEDSWGEGTAPQTPADEARGDATAEDTPEEPAEERGEYLGADPLETGWSRTWYTVGEERQRTEIAEPLPGQESTGATDAAAFAEIAAGAPQPPLPPQEGAQQVPAVSGLSLTPLVGTWDDDVEWEVRESWARRLWDEKGTKVIVPTALALTILLGIVMMVLNVIWAAGG